MCWKYEWAKAINNLNRAIVHVQRAKAKIEKRWERNKRNLDRIISNPKFNYPTMREPVLKLMHRNSKAIMECEDLIHVFKEAQTRLHGMIKLYGITHKPGNKTVEKLLGRRNKH